MLSLFLFLLFLGGATCVRENAGARGSADSIGRNLMEVVESSQVLDDTFVRSSSPTKNYNGVTNLGVAYGSTYNERITFAKFPISFQVQNAVSITSAIVRMRANQVTGNITVSVYKCDSENWSESVITFNNRPTYDSSTILEERLIVPSDAQTWLDFDLTNSFIAAAQAQASSLSLVFESDTTNPPTPSELVKFDSKEDTVNIPYVEVTYVPSGVSSPPTGAPSQPPTIDYDQPSYPQLVALAADGTTLNYTPYANEINLVQNSIANPAAVNTVPDFSNVGYRGGGEPIPFIPVQRTVSPLSLCISFTRPRPFNNISSPLLVDS